MTDLTTHDLTQPKFIINTPGGYFVHWVVPDTIAHLNSDRAAAKQMSSDEADEVVRGLKRLGFSVSRIEVNP